MYTFIFDIGKTNVKGAVLDDRGQTVWTRSNPSVVQRSGDYPSIDVEGIWRWLQATLKAAAERFAIGAINVSTHGACAVLLSRDDELLFPVMDYEVERLEIDGVDYDSVRPPYTQTQSPQFDGGLNLGRQIWWLQQTYPDRFRRLGRVLLYPQYWVWKLTGCAVSEATSLGCHTDLWEPLKRRYSTLVAALGIERALPPVVDSFTPVANVRAELARELGLPDCCAVYPGVHDSNGGLARYLASELQAPFTVISTGTWVIAMALGNPGDSLQEARDMLANVDVRGEPVPCARFMGGREFEIICKLTNAAADDKVLADDIRAIVADRVFAVPPFEPGSGPFRHSESAGRLTGAVVSGKSLATLYLALMMDYELELLNASGPVLFGSASLKNPLLCQLLAQLRPQQPVLMSNDTASTIKGAWCLTRWQQQMPAGFSSFETASPSQIEGLQAYRHAWRSQAG